MHEALLAHGNAEGMQPGCPVLEATEPHGADIGTWQLVVTELTNRRCTCSSCYCQFVYDLLTWYRMLAVKYMGSATKTAQVSPANHSSTM